MAGPTWYIDPEPGRALARAISWEPVYDPAKDKRDNRDPQSLVRYVGTLGDIRVIADVDFPRRVNRIPQLTPDGDEAFEHPHDAAGLPRVTNNGSGA